MEIFQLTVSAAFFIHNFLQLKSANSIIKDAQKAKLLEIRKKLDIKNYQKINFDREIMLYQNKANSIGKSENDGNEITIKNINSLLKLPNWKENFGKAVHPESSAAIHALQPTHLTTNNFDIILRENAILKAQYSHKTRYDGNRINQKSTNTILAIPPHQLDIKLANEA
uniref:DUF4781 domain-containing protein n=1 Tax=Panagrolaimus sp. PS1159 TaxID=55785 RepID=A0AC35FHG4_9BILA